METKGCHNCKHQYVNNKRCDLPFGVGCNSFNKWEQRKNVLSVFKEQDKLNIPAVINQRELLIDFSKWLEERRDVHFIARNYVDEYLKSINSL
jgi:hypothetical protein